MTDIIDIRKLHGQRQPDTQKATGNAGTSDTTLWAFLQKEIHVFGAALPDKIKESFYLELNTMLAAGMDIKSSLELIMEEQPKKQHRQIFNTILQQVVAGSTLSSALKAGKDFTPYEYYSIQIGEETGKLVIVLGELAAYFKKKIDQRRQIIGAMTYPVLVIMVAGLAVSFMMNYVVPMFADVLKRFGGDLPFITKLVLHLSFLTKKFTLPFLLFSGAVAGGLIAQRRKHWLRRAASSLLLRIPLIGGIIQKIYLSRFANTMSLLVGSRIPLLQSLQLVEKMIGFFPIESSLADVKDSVLSGTPLYSSLGHHSIYPKKMIALIKVGEEVNQLDIFFDKISRQYSSDVEYQTTLLSKFMEPLIIVVLGLVVGVILIAMYLPLFKLGQTF